jgi:hypothetical protein
MPTSNPRINVTFEPALAALLASLARQENKSVSALAKELVIEALERREDMALSAIASLRDKAPQKLVSHDEAWQ